MAERNAGLSPEHRIEFRVGIHLGDVVEEVDGDLMGDGVNIAARLEGICAPGAICLSEDAYRQVSGRLDMAVADLGPTRLKNIERSIRVYSLQVGVPAQAKPVTATKPAHPKRRSALALLSAGIVALVLLAAGAWFFLAANRTAPVASNASPPPAAARLSVVGLPFANLSGDPAQDYLADALTDELTTSLARIGGSFVIARNTAFTYKGKSIDAKAIGKDLGVRYVLEGSVQPSGNQMRVNAQLIDADSGAHLWADQFDAARADLLRTQDDIVSRLAHEMQFQLPEAEAARLKRTPAANPDAEDLALQCQAGAEEGGYIGKEAEAAYRLCEQALALDPNNSRALGNLSIKFYLPVLTGNSDDPKSDLQRAEELASRALALDPNDAGLHVVMAGTRRGQRRADEAIAEYERALALDPAEVDAVKGLGFTYLELGQFEKSLEYLDKTIRHSPHDPELSNIYSGKARDYNELGQYDQAIESARRAIAISPSKPLAYQALSQAYIYTGEFEKSLESCDTAIRLSPQNPICYIRNAGAYFAMKQYDQAIEWARRAITIRPNNSFAHGTIIAALALTGHGADAHEALQHYLALPPDLTLPPDAVGMRTIAAWKAYQDKHTGPAVVDFFGRRIEGLRKAGMPEE
jgi:adenylate cyclase